MKEANLSAHLYAKHLPGRSYAHILITFDGSELASSCHGKYAFGLLPLAF
jgi:hypothetical protein